MSGMEERVVTASTFVASATVQGSHGEQLRVLHAEVVVALHELAQAIRAAESHYDSLAGVRDAYAGRLDAIRAELRTKGYAAGTEVI